MLETAGAMPPHPRSAAVSPQRAGRRRPAEGDAAVDAAAPEAGERPFDGGCSRRSPGLRPTSRLVESAPAVAAGPSSMTA